MQDKKRELKESVYHVGTVVNNNYPRNLYRVRVRIPVIFDNIVDSELPWAVPLLNSPNGGSNDYGSVSIQAVGSQVLIRFQGGSELHPVYEGTYGNAATALAEALTNYPHRNVLLYPCGSLLVIDNKTKELFFRNSGDFNIFIEGNVNLQVNGNLNQRINGSRYTQIRGNDVLVVEGDVTQMVDGDYKREALEITDKAIEGHGIWAGTNTYRGAGGIISDNDPSFTEPVVSEPNIPQFSEWTGIRGNKPNV